MALTGNMIALAISGNPSVINYGMFVSVISLLSLFYLITATVQPKFSIHPIIMIGVDLLNVLFWFCGAIAFAAELHVGSCGDAVSTFQSALMQLKRVSFLCLANTIES